MKRRNVVIFLSLMGMFVTATQAFSINTLDTTSESSSLNRHEGSQDFLTVYESKPLGKNKVLGTLEITNRLGSTVTAYMTIIPSDSREEAIPVGSVTTYDYRIGSGSWVTEQYEDLTEMMVSIEVTILNDKTKNVHVIFEKENLASDYYMSSIIVQEKDS